jgi:hypothetical protein
MADVATHPAPSAPLLRHAGYPFAWPGLDAAAFLNPERLPKRPSAGEWLSALGKLALGLAERWRSNSD